MSTFRVKHIIFKEYYTTEMKLYKSEIIGIFSDGKKAEQYIERISKGFTNILNIKYSVKTKNVWSDI